MRPRHKYPHAKLLRLACPTKSISALARGLPATILVPCQARSRRDGRTATTASSLKLEDFAALDTDAFVEEVRKRRPKGEARLTPASLRALRSGYEEGAVPIREARAEAARLECRLSDLVNKAYGLSPEEVELLWSTAPPRMPRF
ncbi:MAG: hypothetical protein M3N33_03015 [Actinomycetota bacterium]|nr:hypothetical protein [Actinomycetota bacterium]